MTPTRHVRSSYPIAATALAYQPEVEEEEQPVSQAREKTEPQAVENGQQALFIAQPDNRRIIPFDQLTSASERESIRARAAQLSRPTPVKSAKAEISPRRNSRSSLEADQQQFDFFGKADLATPPASPIQCGAPVAPHRIRFSAALVDAFMIFSATFTALAVFRFASGALPVDKLALGAYTLLFAAIALTYKLVWCFANRDSYGTVSAGLRVVDLDGNPPTQRRRFWRAFSSLLSFGAVGLGLVWTFADADGLAWHDHISSTFPTISEE